MLHKMPNPNKDTLLRLTSLSLLLACIALQACSSSNKNQNLKSAEGGPKAETPKAAVPAQTPKAEEPAQLETGRAAFQKVYSSARIWAPDAQPLRIESRPRKGDGGGKAQVWAAAFASASKRAIRNFLWSGATDADAPEPGISPGSIDVYSPGNASTQPFDMNYLKVDSDQAFDAAQKHGGSAILKKNPDLLTKYVLVWEPQQNRLLWRIIYGDSEANAKMRVFVNASTGTFLKVEK